MFEQAQVKTKNKKTKTKDNTKKKQLKFQNAKSLKHLDLNMTIFTVIKEYRPTKLWVC